MTPCPVVVLISGSGSNLQALIDSRDQGERALEIRCVISNQEGVRGLERAQQAQLETRCLSHRAFACREDYDHALIALIDSYAPELVILAGFMRILTPAFVRHYAGRLLNIHPSLLPKFPGLHTHERALAAGETTHGATVHFVTETLDGGPAILQAEVPVLPDDDVATLAARVLEQEHRIYPQVAQWFAAGRLRLGEDGVAYLDGRAINSQCPAALCRDEKRQ